jgi:hypothetical protein
MLRYHAEATTFLQNSHVSYHDLTAAHFELALDNLSDEEFNDVSSKIDSYLLKNSVCPRSSPSTTDFNKSIRTAEY